MEEIFQRKEFPCRCLIDAANSLRGAAYIDANKVKERDA